MKSDGLIRFEAAVGNAVLATNTVCIGLDGVANERCKKTDFLTISWATDNPKGASMSARNFAIRSSLVYVGEAFQEYLEYINEHSSDDSLKKILSRQGEMRDKIKALSKRANDLRPYWESAVVLLVRWRNKVVHGSQTGLSEHYKKTLRAHKSEINQLHADIDIEQTLEHFASNKITLKDFSTLICITTYYVQHLDAVFDLSKTKTAITN